MVDVLAAGQTGAHLPRMHQPLTPTFKESPAMTKPRLAYFDFAGSRGEECRIALHLAGVDFDDVRVAGADWPASRRWASRTRSWSTSGASMDCTRRTICRPPTTSP